MTETGTAEPEGNDLDQLGDAIAAAVIPLLSEDDPSVMHEAPTLGE